MSLDRKCPKCGSTKVQLTQDKSKHSLIKLIFFGIFYIVYLMYKWIVAFAVLICYDWWMAIISKSKGKGYTWKSKKWFSLSKKTYYCQACGHNFRG